MCTWSCAPTCDLDITIKSTTNTQQSTHRPLHAFEFEKCEMLLDLQLRPILIFVYRPTRMQKSLLQPLFSVEVHSVYVEAKLDACSMQEFTWFSRMQETDAFLDLFSIFFFLVFSSFASDANSFIPINLFSLSMHWVTSTISLIVYLNFANEYCNIVSPDQWNRQSIVRSHASRHHKQCVSMAQTAKKHQT